MDWKLFAQLAATGLVTVIGWWVVNFFSKRRDIENDRRKLRTEYLLEAYRRLEGASHREGRQKEFEDGLESAIADIQLLGTAKQADLASRLLLIWLRMVSRIRTICCGIFGIHCEAS